MCWRRKLKSIGRVILSFRWDEHCLGGWCSFFVGFIGKNALAGRREVTRWTVFSNAECREPARRTGNQFTECRELAR